MRPLIIVLVIEYRYVYFDVVSWLDDGGQVKQVNAGDSGDDATGNF